MIKMKRKANGEGNIRQRSDGTWEARYCLKDGTRESIYGKTKADVRKKLTAIMNEVDEDDYIEETNMTVGEWMDTWLKDFANVRYSTHCRYERDIRNHIKPAIGKYKLKDLTTLQIQKLYTKMKEQGLSPKTIYNVHGTLHEALKIAVNMDYIRKNVSERCSLPKLLKPEMHPLLDQNATKFLEAIKGHPYEDEMFFAMFTGLRESEVIGLTWDCIDFKRGSICVYRQFVKVGTEDHHGIYDFTPLKNDRTRTLEPASQVMDLLRNVQKKQEENKQRLGSSYNNELNLVFTHVNGTHIQYHTLYKQFKAVVA